MKSDIPKSQDLITLIGHFDVNVSWSDEVKDYISSFSQERLGNLKAEMKMLLKNNILSTEDFYQATACKAKNEATARQFFKDVYKYAFEDGEEPDVTDYWNR